MHLRLATVLLFVLGAAPRLARATEASPVAVVQSADWNVGDAARDGAGEFAVFLRVAQLQQQHRAVALVAVCDRHGLLRSGGERALRRVVCDGVIVAKLAPADTLDGAGGVFLDGASLSPDTARQVLARCLARHGAPPAALDPAQPTQAELAAIRAHLRPFQIALHDAAKQRAAVAAL